MHGLRQLNSELTIKFDVEELNPTQVRLIKSINTLLSHVLTADEESEYFNSSAELVKKVAEAIKHSNFASEHKQCAYGTQAVEFAVDYIHEVIDQNKIANIDN